MNYKMSPGHQPYTINTLTDGPRYHQSISWLRCKQSRIVNDKVVWTMVQGHMLIIRVMFATFGNYFAHFFGDHKAILI